jgi:uncharacterized protein with GYD domain
MIGGGSPWRAGDHDRPLCGVRSTGIRGGADCTPARHVRPPRSLPGSLGPRQARPAGGMDGPRSTRYGPAEDQPEASVSLTAWVYPEVLTVFRRLCEKVGAQVRDTYRTMGRSDVAAIVDAPDDVTMNAVVYSLGSLGNIRTETPRAFTRQETDAALAKVA